jgi:hypothetical protein
MTPQNAKAFRRPLLQSTTLRIAAQIARPVFGHLLATGLLAAFAACTAHAPVPVPVAPPVPPPHVSITGLIVNGVTSRPLVGAIVDIDGHMQVESGPDGRFRIDDVAVGPHLLATRAHKFRSRIQPVDIIVPDADPEAGRRNDFIVLLFAPSPYFDGFPVLGSTPPCRSDGECAKGQICLMNNFREMDAPACAIPKACSSETDCKIGQQCEPIRLASGEEMRVCHGQPAPEVEP